MAKCVSWRGRRAASRLGLGLALVLAAPLVVGPASAQVPEGEYCLSGLGASGGGATDGWVQHVDRSGVATTLLSGDPLVDAWDCAIDPTTGDVIVVDEGPGGSGTNGVIYRIDPNGGSPVVSVVRSGAPLVNPRGLTVGQDGTLYVSDRGGSGGTGTSDGAVYAVTPAGAITRLDAPGSLVNPRDLDLDPRPFAGTGAGVNLIVIDDSSNRRIDRVPISGTPAVVSLGTVGGGSTRMESIEVGPWGNYFIADDATNQIIRRDRLTGNEQSITDPSAPDPKGVSVDYFTGNLLVADDDIGLSVVPPSTYLAGGPAGSNLHDPTPALENPRGVGFSPPRPSADPSAQFGMPTRRAPVPGATLTVMGSGNTTANGDVENELNLFIEVTDASRPLRIHIFDADVLDGYDATGGDGSYDTDVTYELFAPNSGTPISSVTVTGGARPDLDQRIATLGSGSIVVGGAGVPIGDVGLYRLRVSADGDDDFGNFGVWVEDFHAYAFTTTFGALNAFSGVAPEVTPLDDSRLYPLFDRGCDYTLSNFDLDVDSRQAQVVLTTRLGDVFDTAAGPPTLTGSFNDDHDEDVIDPSPGGGALSNLELDYGDHALEISLSPTSTENNLVGLRAPDFQGFVDAGGGAPPVPVPPGNPAANPTAALRTSPSPAHPIGGPASGANTFLRLYLPRYDEAPSVPVFPGSAAQDPQARPAPPYMTHNAVPLHDDPPTQGSTSIYGVVVTVVNPDPVNALNSVSLSVPVPGPAQYVETGTNVGGGAVASNGGVATPPCSPGPCSGTLTASWASIPAGATRTLTYAVQIAPQNAGDPTETLYLTGGPSLRSGAANAAPTPGTQLTFTPAWSGSGGFARSESLGPLCDLSVVEGTATPVAVDLARFEAEGGDGLVRVVWETASEFENLGFRLWRRRLGDAAFRLVTRELVVGRGSSEFTARYAVLDDAVENGEDYEYQLEDIEFDGDTMLHGPVQASPRAGARLDPLEPAGFQVWISTTTPSPEAGAPGSAEGPTPGDAGGGTAGPTPGDAGGVAGSPAGAATPAPPAPGGGFAVLEQGSDELRVEIQVPPLELESVTLDGDRWTRVSAPGWERSVAPGLPELPVRTLWLEGPDRTGIELEVLEREGEERVLEAPVLPVASPAGDGGSRLAADPGAYASPRPYPDSVVRLAGSVRTAPGQRRIALRVQPARFVASEGRLEVDRHLRVRVRFTGPEALASDAPATAQAENRRAVAALPGVKLVVEGSGLVRVPAAELLEAGLDPTTDPRRLHLFRQGLELAAAFEGEADGRLDPQDALLFWAPGHQDRYTASDAFFLAAADTPGLRADRIDAAPEGPAGASTASATTRLEEQQVYLPGVLNGEGDNFVGPFAFDQTLTTRVPTPARVAGEARLRVRLRGGTTWSDVDPDHHFTLLADGIPLLDLRFDGTELFEAEVPLPAPTDPRHVEVALRPEFDSGAPFDLIYLDAIELRYPRRLVLEPADAGRLRFRAERDGEVAVGGLGDPATARVWDVSDPDLPVRLRDLARGEEGLVFRALAGHDYAVSEAPLAARARWNAPSSHGREGGADWVAIAHRDLLEGARELAALREAQGLRTTVIDVEDLYDEAGGRFDPRALRGFLRQAARSWSPAPRYVVLVGDASYDYRDFLAGRSTNQVPTMLVDTAFVEAASDTWFALLDDADAAADLALGRLPVSDPEALAALVEKIARYERQPEAAWPSRLLLVADDGAGAGNDFEAEAFERSVDGLARHAGPGLPAEVLRLRELPDASEADAANAAIRAAIERGTGLVFYAGHGGALQWADEIVFGVEDFDTLIHERWPFFVVINCLNGFFDAPSQEAFGEVALESPDRGAIGVLSSTTVSAFAGQEALAAALGERMLRFGERRLGDAVTQAFQSLAGQPGAEDALRSFVLLGDPATSLALPVMPVADAGSDRDSVAGAWVQLDGSASFDPRGEVLSFAWRSADDSPVKALRIRDSGDPARPWLRVDEPGVARVALEVSAAGRTGAVDEVEIGVAPAPVLSCAPQTQQPGPRLSALDGVYLALPLAFSGLARRRRRR